LFSLGPSFGVDGNLIVSDSTFARLLGRDSRDIDVGSITLKPGVDPQKVLVNLKANLYNDVQVFTQDGFIDFEKKYWAERTPIGFTLNLMLTMGSVIGVVIVYQILYTNISNHIVAYATLKAMGHTNKYLLSVVFQQAFILAILGYIPGFAFTLGLYDVARQATKLPMSMTIDKAFIILIAAIAMCMISGALAIRKLQNADPADIF